MSQSFAAQGALPIHAFDQTEPLLGIQELILELVLVGYNECKRATWSAWGQTRPMRLEPEPFLGGQVTPRFRTRSPRQRLQWIR